MSAERRQRELRRCRTWSEFLDQTHFICAVMLVLLLGALAAVVLVNSVWTWIPAMALFALTFRPRMDAVR